uniref:Uncharacterized protein n=1 Tax=Rhizophora mucronata TaxID=61149 RepID=A0A2P2Q6F9_RHIMU
MLAHSLIRESSNKKLAVNKLQPRIYGYIMSTVLIIILNIQLFAWFTIPHANRRMHQHFKEH